MDKWAQRNGDTALLPTIKKGLAPLWRKPLVFRADP